MSFIDYAEWFLESIKCNSECCRHYEYKNENKGLLCNYNFSNYKENNGYPVRPQAGYIDDDWFEKDERILLLGLNPRGGYEEDNDLYSLYDEIIKMGPQGLTNGKMECIRKQVDKYWVLTLLKNKIQEMSPAAVFAYANQVLCRTYREANEIRIKDGIESVYKACFKNRLSKLIKVLGPTKIITVGWKWEKYFKARMQAMNEKIFDYICTCHPTYGRSKAALEQIESFLNKENMNGNNL